MQIRIARRAAFVFFVGMPVLLILLSIPSILAKEYVDAGWARAYTFYFDVNGEDNFPTFYAGLSLLLCAGVLAGIGADRGRRREAYSVHWVLLGVIFLYLSLDEVFQIHEMTSGPLNERFDFTGVLWDSWIVIWGPAALIVGFAFTGFLRHLPRDTAIRFVVSGALYVWGAVGMEMISANYGFQRHAQGLEYEDMTYLFIEQFAEFFEFLAIGLFLFALVDYIRNQFGEIRLVLGDGAESPK